MHEAAAPLLSVTESSPPKRRSSASLAVPTKRARPESPSPSQLRKLLSQFDGTKGQPKSSRVVADAAQVANKPLGLLDSWRYVPFIVGQGECIH